MFCLRRPYHFKNFILKAAFLNTLPRIQLSLINSCQSISMRFFECEIRHFTNEMRDLLITFGEIH